MSLSVWMNARVMKTHIMACRQGPTAPACSQTQRELARCKHAGLRHLVGTEMLNRPRCWDRARAAKVSVPPAECESGLLPKNRRPEVLLSQLGGGSCQNKFWSEQWTDAAEPPFLALGNCCSNLHCSHRDPAETLY